MGPTEIRAVIIDRDETLLQIHPGAVAQLEARIQAIAPDIPSGSAAAAWMRWPGPWPQTEADEPAFWRAFWAGFADQHELSASQGLALAEIGAFYHTCFAAFPDAAPCIQALYAHGMRLAVLTNYELPSVHKTLAASGLNPDLFIALVSSTMIGVQKPDPRAYLAVAEALGVSPQQCAFVDDIPGHVAAACALGMRGIVLDRQGKRAHSDLPYVTNLHELIDLFVSNDRGHGES
jgi:FMN phosphatase YigB (HAD superfamily)